MFSEDIGLLPKDIFTGLLAGSIDRPRSFESKAKRLFDAMKKGGFFGADDIDWFNGGLFNDDDVLPLTSEEIKITLEAAELDWRDIDPSIFGTLFERGLDPAKRSQLGAHYTDRVKIMMIIDPVIKDPLLKEWETIKQQLEPIIKKANAAQSKSVITKNFRKAEKLYNRFLSRLANFTVLDPACGSGNFLYLALYALKDLEYRVMNEAEEMGIQRGFPQVGPESVLGIEINPYAAELARVTIWIGEIQWMLYNGFNLSKDPILKDIQIVECRDALINEDGSEASWQKADVIIGNPPFLGDKKMILELGEEYVSTLRSLYKGRVPGGADLVTYWFEKARAEIETGRTKRVGLVATNSIRGGKNRKVLDRIKSSADIYHAWSDEPWVVDGAAVRVSIICCCNNEALELQNTILDNQNVKEILPNLVEETAKGGDITRAVRLKENKLISFMGVTQSGPFNISGEIARDIVSYTNANGKSNSDILKPTINGKDITKRLSGEWIVDFGNMSIEEASHYVLPFQYALDNIKPVRVESRTSKNREFWWLFERSRPQMCKAISSFSRYIVTPRVSKYRIFVWSQKSVLPDCANIAIARDDDTTFGILHSRFHELWSLKTCTWLGKGNDPRYTPTTTFETFPFPDGLAPNIPASVYERDHRAIAISNAAKQLNEQRESWLNPPELTKRVPEVVEGYPDRILPIDKNAEKIIKKLTMTNLYNNKPEWLMDTHDELDKAVAAAYGWSPDITDNEVIKNLLDLNKLRSEQTE
jgi:type II restriction/modification system DNA methylase subunit YeeA